MLRNLLLTLLLLLHAFVPSTAQAAAKPQLEWCLDDLPSYHAYPAEGIPYGPTVDFMLELARRAGFELTFSPNTPFARCLRLMEQGEVDLMVRLNASEHREKVMYMLPYALARPEILLIRQQQQDILTVADLNRLHLMVVRGYTYNHQTLNVIAGHPRSSVIDSVDTGLKMLQMHRADALVTTEEYAMNWFSRVPEYQQQFKQASLSFESSEPHHIHVALSKASAHAHLKPKLQQAIASMIADGTLNPKKQEQTPLN
ncbi:transporter substrate-binding domain-containing protein [Alkalimonas delamerensis]|uniref:Transporter substrate-binding domain-containing protein n=1 Tax=Alkalimonas delamerensis TaxID=265981 RepID=A0ABT9GKB1_9GAMM|nr:transporter substrate-binding domain-containing protein [Alkalimonas delamerensis]MDP4527413.1 transporter substrate-binding domain-containing protein [Alkalimonas delamerensis]